MATISPTRPSRRATARKKAILEDSEDEDMGGVVKAEPLDEDDFTPAPQRSPRRQTRRKTTEVTATPYTAGRVRRARPGESVEPSQIFEHDERIPPNLYPQQRRPRHGNARVRQLLEKAVHLYP